MSKAARIVETRHRMVNYLETLGIHNGESGEFISFTKRDVYKGIGLEAPTPEFESAWRYLAYSTSIFMVYDKELKKWLWL